MGMHGGGVVKINPPPPPSPANCVASYGDGHDVGMFLRRSRGGLVCNEANIQQGINRKLGRNSCLLLIA